MNENLDLRPGFRAPPNLRQAALPGQHHPLHAHFRAPADAGGIVNRHLGAGMHPQPRPAFPDHRQQAQILHQHPVRPQAVQKPQQLFRFRQLPILHQGIHRYVNPHMMQMGKADRLCQLISVKIPGTGPGAEGRVSQIHRVRSGRLCPLQ